MPPTTRKTTPAKKAPAKKAPAKRVAATRKAKDTPEPKKPTSIAEKRAKTMGADAPDQYAPTTWGQTAAVGFLVDLDLPSGQRVLAQRPGPEGLLVAGLLDDMDMLGGMIPGTNKRSDRPVSKNAQLKAMTEDPVKLQKAMRMLDKILVHVVIKPQLTNEPDDPADKVPGNIYPSSVGLEDKMFIFNWCVGGTTDLARFRAELSEHVEAVASSEDVDDAS